MADTLKAPRDWETWSSDKGRIRKSVFRKLWFRSNGEAVTRVARVGVAVFSVDSLVYDHGLPAPTLVKIDVDGIEPDVIAGMERTLAEGSIQSLVTEVTGEENARDMTAALEAHGYRCSHGIPAGLGNHSCDIIFDRDAGT